MHAKFIYSKPKFKAVREVISDANGNIISIGHCLQKHGCLPRYTVCSIYNKETKTLQFGIARCSSKDYFSKEIGRKISYYRALNKPIFTYSIADDNRKISSITYEISQRLINQNAFTRKDYGNIDV